MVNLQKRCDLWPLCQVRSGTLGLEQSDQNNMDWIGSVIDDNNPRNCDFYVFIPQSKCGVTLKSYNFVARDFL